MTIGHELEKITGLKLFHNHMTIEIIAPLFGYGSTSPVGTKLVSLFRKKIFEEFAKSDQEGLIFTYIWAFSKKKDWDYVEKICNIFKSKGADVFFVELEADTEERIKRNKTPHRLNHKPTKKNIEQSEKDLKDSMKKYRMNSKDWEIKEKNYIRINNTNLSPDDVAKKIKDKFKL